MKILQLVIFDEENEATSDDLHRIGAVVTELFLMLQAEVVEVDG